MGTVKEIWKSPPSLARPWIEVSNLGRLRSVARIVKFVSYGKTVKKHFPTRILKCGRDTRGRRIYSFTDAKSGSIRGYIIARLVAECFVPNLKPKEQEFVFHKDGKLRNDKASNLEWGSQKDKNKILRGRFAKNWIGLFEDKARTKEVFRFRGIGETARFFQSSKQAVWQSLKCGCRFRGYYVAVVGSCKPIKKLVADVH